MKPTINGTGPLVIFINGGGCGQWMWKFVIERLEGFKTITFDYEGYAGEPGVFSGMDREIEKIKALIEQEADGQPVCLVGHSLGAQIALKAADLADRVIAISALNTFMPSHMKSTLAMSRWAMPLAKYRWFAKLNASSFGIGEELFEDYYRDTKQISTEWFTNMIVANMTFHAEKPSVEKVTVVVGEKELKVMLASAKTLSDAPIIVAGAKHDIPFAYPELVVSWINPHAVEACDEME